MDDGECQQATAQLHQLAKSQGAEPCLAGLIHVRPLARIFNRNRSSNAAFAVHTIDTSATMVSLAQYWKHQ